MAGPSPIPPSDLWAAFVALLPVITGGVIGVLGALAGTRYGSRLTAQREHKAERRDKLEALVLAAYELDVWFKREENAFLWGGPENLEPSPLATVETMTLLHFPQLKAAGDVLSLAAKQYRMWILEGRQKKLQANPQLVPQEHMNGLQAVYLPFLEKRQELLDRAKQEMAGLNAS